MEKMVFELFASFFDCFITYFFITKFNYVKSKNNLSFYISLLISFSFQIFSDIFLSKQPVLVSTIQFCIALIYALKISKAHKIRAVISVCIIKVTLIALSSSLFYLYGIIFNDFESLLLDSTNSSRYVYVVTHKVLLFMFAFLILKYTNREEAENLLSGILTFLFSSITVAGLGVSISITLYNNPDQIDKKIFFISFVFLILNILLYIMLSLLSALQKKNFELKLHSEIMAFESEKYQEALSIWNQSEKIRHDIRHHLSVLSGMLDNEDISGCKKYIRSFVVNTQSNSKFTNSGNSVIDYLISSKLSPLESTEIIVTGTVPSLIDIEDSDLASLIGNILDNAIEAQDRLQHKRIELSFSSQHENRFILCKNSIIDSVLNSNADLKTTKIEPHHGYGCQIIAEIVKKYGGFVRYFEDNGMFCVQIRLPNNMSSSDNL